MQALSNLIANSLLLALIIGILINGHLRKVAVYDSFVDGAKDGFSVVIKIVPFLVGMLVAIGMLRASGFFTSLSHLLAPFLDKVGVPSDLVPLALIRPFSGGASNALLVDIIHQHGADALISQMGATIIGSTETTFYVVAVYFGSVAVKQTRHAVPAGLLADAAGVIASIAICRLLFAGS